MKKITLDTWYAIKAALATRTGMAVFTLTSLIYFMVFLYTVDLLHIVDGAIGVEIAPDPLSRATTHINGVQFEPIIAVSLGYIELFFSPITYTAALSLSLLVALNLAVGYTAWRGPSSCGLESGIGATAGLPGLIAGFACCGPTILIVLGIQISAGLLTLFQWLLPITVVLLGSTLLWVGSKVERTVLETVQTPGDAL